MFSDASCHVIHLLAPFDLALTAGVARRLPSNILYPIRNGELRIVMSLNDENWVIGVRQVDSLTLVYRAIEATLSDARREAVEANLRRLLGLDVDLAPLASLFAREPFLGPLAVRLPGLRPPRFLSLWETFVQVIPFQQVSLAAAMTMLNRLALAFGPRVRVDGTEYVGMPDLKQTHRSSEAALRGCAEWMETGKIREEELESLSDDEAAVRLVALPGIGPWSAQLILLRGFGRLGIFPAGDSGAARGLREVFTTAPDPDAAAAAALARLGSWRGYLYFMLLGRRILTAG